MIHVTSTNFAEAHHTAVAKCLRFGDSISTDYDKEDEHPSIDVPAIFEISDPWGKPTWFSQCAVDSPESIVRYADEIVHGTMDHLTEELSYTYHDRFKDQVEGVIKELKRNMYTRRAQFITWIPEYDLGAEYPPCFQRGWLRVRRGLLDFHTHWRSRDLMKAWASNVFGFAHLHKWFAEHLDLPVGVYREFIDSLHVYGRDIQWAENMLSKPFERWIWAYDDILKEAGVLT